MSNYLTDVEFGKIKINHSKLATNIKLKISQTGDISLSMPPRTPLFLAKSLINQSREQLRTNLARATINQKLLQNNDQIGKSHKLVIKNGAKFNSRLTQNLIIVELPAEHTADSKQAQDFIKNAAIKALKMQAKFYLSRQLFSLAKQHGYQYKMLRFSTAGTRWGSCSTSGTISLNVWLMELPPSLIDYVIVHELCHTRQMNHSKEFWLLVEQIMPDYKVKRLALKNHQPRY